MDDADHAEEALVAVLADVLDLLADPRKRGSVLEVRPPVLILDDERPWHQRLRRPASLLRTERLNRFRRHHRILDAADTSSARAR